MKTIAAILLLFGLVMVPFAYAQEDPAQGKAWTPAQYCKSIPDQCEILDVECKIWDIPLDPRAGNKYPDPQFLCITKFCSEGGFYTVSGAAEMTHQYRTTLSPHPIKTETTDIGALGLMAYSSERFFKPIRCPDIESVPHEPSASCIPGPGCRGPLFKD